MNVLFVNNFFYDRGGAEKSLFNTARLLEKKKHSVYFMCSKFKENKRYLYDKYFIPFINYKSESALEKLRGLSQLYYNFEAHKKTKLLLNEVNNIDIVHMNNIMYRIGPSMIRFFKNRNIPVVFHLRDYNLMCGTINLLANGQICDECKGYKFSNIFKNNCTGLIGGIIIYTTMIFYHKIMKYFDDVDIFISPSNFLKEKYIEMGFNKNIKVIPNFVNVEDLMPCYENEDNSYIYFGRLSQEKGLNTLLKVCKKLSKHKFKITGAGPLEEIIHKFILENNLTNVKFLGYLKGKELCSEIKKSKASVVPSEWYENNSRAILESMAFGKPVIASQIGGNPELVRDKETGYLFEPFNEDDLADKIILLENVARSKEFGKRAREIVERNYNSQIYYERLMDIYIKAIKRETDLFPKP